MNNLDIQYQNLLSKIITEGQTRNDRTGTGRRSIFGQQIRHKMSEGFPILTTKKVHFHSVITELLWFIRGETNIRWLVNNNCNIWNGDAYKKFKLNFESKPKFAGFNKPIMTKEEFVDQIKNDNKFAEIWGELGPIYGKQWRQIESVKKINYLNDNLELKYNYESVKIDQFKNLITDIILDPFSTRLIVNSWNVSQLEEMTLPPCHYSFQIFCRELSIEERLKIYADEEEINLSELKDQEKTENEWKEFLRDTGTKEFGLSLMWNQRSVDTFLGLPFNITSYGLLLEIICIFANAVPDELIGVLGDTHLYSNHIEQAEEQIKREPYELPKLEINRERWGYLSLKSDNLDEMIDKIIIDDFNLINYISHSKISAPLSN